MTSSLGIIETIGLTTAIHAADAACKAAGVNLTGYRKAGSGLVSVYFEGEISAVKVAIDSGLAAIADQQHNATSLIMARPDPSVLMMIENGPITNTIKKQQLTEVEAGLSGLDTELVAPTSVDKIAETSESELDIRLPNTPLPEAKAALITAVPMDSLKSGTAKKKLTGASHKQGVKK